MSLLLPHAWPADRFGHKAANLATLDRMLAGQAVVPPFFAVEDAAVAAFLGPGFTAAAAALQQQLAEDASAGMLGLTTRALGRMYRVQRFVRRAFAGSGPLPGGPALTHWLALQAGHRLMVRSTGREDTAQLANAGGNESVANVPAEAQALRAAMAKVVASYFDCRSLQQRLLAGDDLARAAFVPVLLQRMVGEAAEGSGAAVPSAGVLLTQEREGPTPGVSHVQATFGHNEAVVQSALPVDTYLVDDAAVHRVVRLKPARLRPTEQGGLGRVANEARLRPRPVLADATVRRLHAIGQQIEAAWRQPMDVEWACAADEGQIYVLQARPLVAPAHGAPPDHVAPQFLLDHTLMVADVVGAGGGRVRVIQRAEDAVVATTLAEALEIFLARAAVAGSADRGVAAVFVAAEAEPTSHEATTLRGAAVPVLRVASTEAVRTALNSQVPLLLDAQGGTLLAGAKLVVDGMPTAGVVLPGWARHPLPARESQLALGADDPAVHAALRGLVAELSVHLDASADAAAAPADEAGPAALLSALWRLLERHARPRPGRTPAAALAAFADAASARDRAQACAELLANVVRWMQGVRAEPSLAARADAVLQASFAAAGRALVAAARARDLAYLYEFNWLRASVTQRTNGYALGADSVVGLLLERRELRRLAAAGEGPLADATHAAVATAAARVGRLAQRAEVREAWASFAGALRAQPGGGRALTRLLVQLQAQDVTAVWLNTVFAAAAATAPQRSAVVLAAELYAPFCAGDSSANDLHAWLRRAGEAADFWQQRSVALGEPARAEGLAQEFVKQHGELWGEEAARRFAAASPAIRLLALGALERAIGSYDVAIKAVTGATGLTAVHKTRLVGAMVSGFAGLLQPWLKNAAPNLGTQKCVYEEGSRTNDWLVPMMVGDLHALRESLAVELAGPDAEASARRQLAPSPNFHVAAAHLGAPADYAQHRPETLEDYFTTVHQSLLQVLSDAHRALGLTHERLAPDLRNFVATLLPVPGVAPPPAINAFRPRVCGVELSASHAAVRLQAPMREHGMTLHLVQRQNAPDTLQLQVEIYSEYDEHCRNLRALVAAQWLALGVGGQLDPQVQPTFVALRPVARWRWLLPLGSAPIEALAARVKACLELVVETSTAAHPAPRRLAAFLGRVAAFVPDLEARLDELDEAHFRAAPWYNEQYFRLLVAQGRTHTPGFAALCAAIDAAPPGQNRRWTPAFDDDVPEEGTSAANATALLAAWRQGGAAALPAPPPLPPWHPV